MKFNIYDIIILVLLAGIVIAIAFNIYRRRGKGCSGCDANCSERTLTSNCSPAQKQNPTSMQSNAQKQNLTSMRSSAQMQNPTLKQRFTKRRKSSPVKGGRPNDNCKLKDTCPMRDSCNSVYCNKQD
jgi:hypothetical protein